MGDLDAGWAAPSCIACHMEMGHASTVVLQGGVHIIVLALQDRCQQIYTLCLLACLSAFLPNGPTAFPCICTSPPSASTPQGPSHSPTTPMCSRVCFCLYRPGVLQSRLRRSKASKMVVFFSNCYSVEFHHELFRRDLQLAHSHSSSQYGASDAPDPVKLLGAVPVLKLHGDMRQPERTSSLVTFSKVCAAIFAHDVLGRCVLHSLRIM